METAFHYKRLVWVVSLLLFLSVAFPGGAFAEKEQGVKKAKERAWRIYWDNGQTIEIFGVLGGLHETITTKTINRKPEGGDYKTRVKRPESN